MASMGFWAGRRVLITGHTGFKGSWLSLWLANRGAAITGIALDPPTKPAMFELAHVARAIETDLRVDTREASALRSAVEAAAPEVVFHLAAQPLVTGGYDQPIETFATNIMGTAHLLDAAMDVPSVKAIVIVTSDKVYENREWVHPYREIDRLGGHDPYATSKACAELVTRTLRSSRTTDALIATVRAGNVVGGGDFARDRIVPDCVRAFAAGTPVMLRHPHAIRPWQHVLDPLAGYIAVAERLHAGEDTVAEAWNFGPETGGEEPVGALAAALAAEWGEDARVELADVAPSVHEDVILRLDSTKARALLKWRPVWGFRDTLGATAEWYSAWHRGADMAATTLEQIARYERDHDALHADPH